MKDVVTGAAPATTLFYGDGVRLAFGVLFTGLLLVACVTDVRSRRISNKLVLALLIGGIVFSTLVVGGASGTWRSVAGIALGFAMWIVFYIAGVLGAGDVKLAAAIGSWLGASGIWRASLIGALAGGVLAVGMLMRERRTVDALGRIMTSASTRSLALLTPAAESSGGVRHRALPYGVALAIGALAAAWIPGLLR